jgi:dynactin 1
MGPPPHLGAKTPARPSIGTALGKATKPHASARPSHSAHRPSLFPSNRHSQSTSREESPARRIASPETPISPSVDEEEYHAEGLLALESDTNIQLDVDDKATDPKTSPKSPQDDASESPTLEAPPNGLVSGRATHNSTTIINRELEQMKIKYKIMEKKRMDDRDKLKATDVLKAERDKFESTVQKLQRKCQSQSQEMAEWRRQLQESKTRAEELETADAGRGTELELVMLDKEMAEERLAAANAELEIMKDKCEELQLEADIIREENRELGSGMTSEEKSGAGWLQMEKENRRLRDALVALRDMTQDTEASLKGHVKELEADLVDFEKLKSEHEKTKIDLVASQAVIKTLKENVDAADHQEFLISQLNEAKEALTEQVKALSKNVKESNKDLADYRELEEAQEQTERLLQEDLDDMRALAVERDHKMRKQAKTIATLESTLLKFKDVLNGLQSDLQELQEKKQISDEETSELNAKSRAMMDLNLRLQNSAAKTQTKKIEAELNQISAEDTALHLAIIENFVPESFKNERDPILTLLRSKRIASKANLLQRLIEDDPDQNDPDQNSSDAQADSYLAFDVAEKLQWVSLCCSRFHNFMRGCSAKDFSKFDAALHELEPVERSLDTMIDAVKRMDMNGARNTQGLQRIIALLSDLTEKTVPSSSETFADTITGRSKMMSLYTENVGNELDLIKDSVRIKIVLSEDDEGFLPLSQQMQRLVDRSRMNLIVAGKVQSIVDDQRKRSMTLRETSLVIFEQAESLGQELSAFVRSIGHGLAKRLKEDAGGPGGFKSYDILNIIHESAREWLGDSSSKITTTTDVMETVNDMLSGFRSKLESIFNHASDLSNFSEFERHPAPWTVRAKTLKERKIIDPQMEAQLSKLQLKAHEQSVSINAKDKEIEQQRLQLETLEARGKTAKDHADEVQGMTKKLTEVVAQRDRAVSELATLMEEKHVLAQKHEEASAKLATMKQKIEAGDPAVATVLATTSESRSAQLASEIEMLKEEITGLQSAVRFLKAENHRLLYPVAPTSLATTSHAWLEANPLPKAGEFRKETGTGVAAEAKDVFKRLLEVTSMLKPLQLQSSSATNATNGGKQSSWRPIRKTPRYIVSQQREELEWWAEWRDDVVQRTVHGQQRHAPARIVKPLGESEAPGTPPRREVVDGVEIVGSPP